MKSNILFQDEDPSSSSVDARDEDSFEMSKEFPTGNLYELEGRVFTDQWSIPYKKEESLGKCLVAATRFASEGTLFLMHNARWPSNGGLFHF